MIVLKIICYSTGYHYCVENPVENFVEASSFKYPRINIPIEEDVIILPDFICDQAEKYVETIREQAVESNGVLIIDLKNRFFKKIANIILRKSMIEVNGRRVFGLYIPCSNNVLDKPGSASIDLDLDRLMILPLLLLPPRIRCTAIKLTRFIKFTMVGFTGLIINLATIYPAKYVLSQFFSDEASAALSSIISFETSLTWNFILHEYWTFKDRSLPKGLKNLVYRWVKFHAGSIGSFISQVLSVTFLNGLFKYPLYLALIIGVILGLIVNYVWSSRFTWR